MTSLSGQAPLLFPRIGRDDLPRVLQLELDPDQVERFLGPLPEILAEVRRGPAHLMFGIEAMGRLAGFFVLHPDRRDGRTWWLGWLALDRRFQGLGHGRRALEEALRRLRAASACDRVRLFVARENVGALRLYERAGFCALGFLRETGELILECVLRAGHWLERGAEPMLVSVVAKVKRASGHRRLRASIGPHAAWVIGVERGPPGPAASA
ncbi:GNAT family N-acetyltransferase [Roseomonas sp. KE2513]|uniref:GNAT family N-acetyltransferase n=1 Tax=Roseomonas sp. KE2513 TaxID=2479202 RepID=UPI0021030EA8|nr:GNAT family N-acetyltransferase [Roseomonas sp. KE2513]MBI0533963.1 GNAT family N-acetyltransferase [Roseomonas sp. KE2513]